jgi:hypothetical protein
MKNPTILIISFVSLISMIAAGSYFMKKNDGSANSEIETVGRNKIVFSNINPIPSELKENYFGGKRSKKKKYSKKNKSKKNGNK